jgi:hypothetical protein
LRKTPIGEWFYDALADLMDEDVAAEKQTAMHVLRWFCDINKIFLQDAAATLCLHPERGEHVIFHVLPVFHTDEWTVHFKVTKLLLYLGLNATTTHDASFLRITLKR